MLGHSVNTDDGHLPGSATSAEQCHGQENTNRNAVSRRTYSKTWSGSQTVRSELLLLPLKMAGIMMLWEERSWIT
jgi:hypothetical protein